MSGVGPGSAPDQGATVVAESRSQLGSVPVFLALLFGVALGRGVDGAQTTAGRVMVAVVFGALIVLVIGGWFLIMRHPARLEVTENAITFRPRNGPVSMLSRENGDELRFVKYRASALSRSRTLGLAIAGTDSVLLLRGFFSQQQIRQACQARGWRVDN